MSPGQLSLLDPHSFPFPKVDFHVLSACAWRIVSELFRRYQTKYELRVAHFYPGLSAHGIISVYGTVPKAPVVSFGLGGGENGRIEANSRQLTISVLDLLRGTPSQVLLQQIAVHAGYESGGGNTPTNPPILVARVFARFLERYMLAPSPFRTTSGFLANSQVPERAEWLEKLSSVWAKVEDDSEGDDPETVRIAQRYWLLHRSDKDAGPCISRAQAYRQASLIFDMETAMVTPTREGGRPHDLFKDYVDAGHRMTPILRWVEDQMEAK